MRKTCEIISDVKDGKKVSYEELKLTCLVQSFIIFQYQQDVKGLLKGGIEADLRKRCRYSNPERSSAEAGISSVYW